MSPARFLWAISGPFLGVYVVVQNLNIPLILQPQIFAFLCAVSWTQVGKQPIKESTLRLSLFPVFILWSQVAVETVSYLRRHLYNPDGWVRGRDDLRCEGGHRPFRGWKPDTEIFFVQPPAEKGRTAPLKFFSIASSVIIALGLLYVTRPFPSNHLAQALTPTQTTILGDLQTQGSCWTLHDFHGGGHQRRYLLDSVSRIQGRIRRLCVDCLRSRHCELSLLHPPVRTRDPTQSLAFTGHGWGYSDRRSHLESHRKT